MDPLKDILTTEREAKNLTREHISGVTGIPSRFLEYLEDGNYRKLPPDAYVFGYLTRLARLYDIEGSALWELYKREKGEPMRSGALDRFPGMAKVEKQKAHSVVKARVIIVSAVTVLALLYIAFQVYSFVRPPQVIISSPVEDIKTDNPELILSGTIQKYTTLTINEEPILKGLEGSFAKRVTLQNGVNMFTFKVRTVLGREAVEVRRVSYFPAQPVQSSELEDMTQ